MKRMSRLGIFERCRRVAKKGGYYLDGDVYEWRVPRRSSTKKTSEIEENHMYVYIRQPG